MQIFRTGFAPLGRLGVLAVVAAALVSGVLVGSNLSPAGAQSGGGEIHGCVNRYTGALRVVSNPEQCTPGERAQSWNQQGPSGILDIQQVRESVAVRAEDEQDEVFLKAVCPAGYRATGGGAGLSVAAAPGIVPWYVESSRPAEPGETGFPNSGGWRANLSPVDGQNANGTYVFFVEAVCVLTAS